MKELKSLRKTSATWHWIQIGLLLFACVAALQLLPFAAGAYNDPCITKSQAGTCKEWSECPIIRTLIERKEYTNREVVSCGFGIREEMICCPEVKTDTKIEVSTMTPRESVSTTRPRDSRLEESRNTATTTMSSSTATTTTTTTTLKPLVVGNQRLNESSEFFDFSQLLNAKRRKNEPGNGVTTRPATEELTDGGGAQFPQGNESGNVNTNPGNPGNSNSNWNSIESNSFGPIRGQNGRAVNNNNNGNNRRNQGRGNNFQSSIGRGKAGLGLNDINDSELTWPPAPNGLNANTAPVRWPNQSNGRNPNGRPNWNWNTNFSPGPGLGGPNNNNNGRVNAGFNNINNNGFTYANGVGGADSNMPNGNGLINLWPNTARQSEEEGSKSFNAFQNTPSAVQIWPTDNVAAASGTSPTNGQVAGTDIDELISNIFQTPKQKNKNPVTPSSSQVDQAIFNTFFNDPTAPTGIRPSNTVVTWPTGQQPAGPTHEQIRQQVAWPTDQQAIGPTHEQFRKPVVSDLDTAASSNFAQQHNPDSERDPIQIVHDNLVNSGLEIVKAKVETVNSARPKTSQFGQQQGGSHWPNAHQAAQQWDQQNNDPFAGKSGQTQRHQLPLPLQPRNPSLIVQEPPKVGFLPNLQSPPAQVLDPFKPFEFRPPPADELNNEGDDNFLRPEPTVAPVTSRMPLDRPAVRACQRIERGLIPGLTPHILGGTPAALGEFPHMVGLGYSRLGDEGEGPYDIRCGGSLIDAQFVLTAAHCVSARDSVPSIVRMGVVNFSDPIAMQNAVEMKIKQIYIHDDYSTRRTYNDIAILELEQPVQYSPDVYPVCLYTDQTDPDAKIKLWVTGWGTVNTTTRAYSNILLKAPLHITPLERCNNSFVDYGLTRQIDKGIIDTQLCAEDKDQTKDACQGDSGGPLNLVVDESYKNYRLVGIISSGFGCASSTPGLYTRVAAFLDYVERIVWPNGGD